MVCAPTCDPGTLLGSSFARDVTLRPVAGNTVLSFGKCSLNWLNAKAVLTRLKRARHTWLLLVGDSDTPAPRRRASRVYAPRRATRRI